jgi:hypothetical protein
VTSLQSSDKVNGYDAASARNDTWAQFTNKMSAKAPTDFELIGWLETMILMKLKGVRRPEYTGCELNANEVLVFHGTSQEILSQIVR